MYQRPIHSFASRSGRAAPLVLGAIALSAVGVVAWRLATADPFEGVTPTAVNTPGEAAPAVSDAQAVLDEMARAEKERIAAAKASNPEGTGQPLTDAMAKLGREELSELMSSGVVEASEEARTLLESGQVIPSHWYRVVGDRVLISDPGAVSPEYAATPAPNVAAVLVDTPTLPKRGTWRGKPVFADLDADGDLDLVASLRMWDGGNKGEGLHVWEPADGGWVERTTGLPRDLGYGGADVADLDGDGRLDIAFGAHNGHPRAFLTRELASETAFEEVSLGLDAMGVSADVALADWTGDGVPEMACVGLFSGTGGLYVYSYDREQRAWFVLAELLVPDDFGYQVRAHDIDNDGRLELLATTNRGVKVYSFTNGAFEDRSAGFQQPIIGGSLLQVLPWDFDGDGVCELLVVGLHNQNGLPVTLHKLVDGTWQNWGSDLPATESFNDAEFVELDGDADPEIFMLGKEGMLLAEMDAQGRFTALARIGSSAEGLYHTHVADLDGDGKHEAVVVKQGGIEIVDLAATFAKVPTTPN
jgi:hypothetical protein